MKTGILRNRPSWRAFDARPLRPELWLIAAVAIGMLLVEVWQSSRVAELSLALGQTRSALTETQAHVEYLRAESERRITRAELAPVATRLGLAPAHASQVVALPLAYLEEDRTPVRMASTASLWTWAERVSRVLVPEATARDRALN